MNHERPIGNSCWVIPGKFLAGEYPGSSDDAAAKAKLKALLDAGITCLAGMDIKPSDCSSALESWYRIVRRTDFNSFIELRQAFPSADNVDNLTVFNIGGNKVRLIAAIHYNSRRVSRVMKPYMEAMV